MTGQRGEASERAGRGAAAVAVAVAVHGVLVIDKPMGPTSHDAVARARRALKTKRIGHAGTLDPMASGVLVVLVGEATKLAPFLTAHEKSYVAVVAFGAATTTLDAEGEITAEAPVPEWLLEEIARAEALGRGSIDGDGGESGGEGGDAALARAAPRLHAAIAAERARGEQVPPAFSAIKVAGQRSYSIARGGGAPELPPRPVSVQRLEIAPRAPAEGAGSGRASVALARVALSMDVSKGYYVRSLARDIGEHLGVPSHLASLRRTKSGPFSLASAVPLDASPEALRGALVPVARAAAESMAVARLTPEGEKRARDGKRLDAADFTEPPPASGELSAWLNPEGGLVAIGATEGSRLVIHRGFAKEEASDE
jgi:tRNA pseudouridine55 synthase